MYVHVHRDNISCNCNLTLPTSETLFLPLALLPKPDCGPISRASYLVYTVVAGDLFKKFPKFSKTNFGPLTFSCNRKSEEEKNWQAFFMNFTEIKF